MTTVEHLTAAASELTSSFCGALIQPSDAAYDAARRIQNGLVDKRPALIAQCRGAADIVEAIKLARDLNLEIAVRGGGHNVGGRAVVDNGVMIDLSLMRSVEVDVAAKTARAGGGTLYGQFNRETQLHGLATTGGIVSTTGIGGLTLGGGLGWLMPKHGMALDNLRSATMVLADGRVVRAASDEHPDLFWAIRGGGGNFGVAASLEYRLHDVGPTVIGGLVAHPIAKARDLLRFFRDTAAGAPDDMMLLGALLTGPDGTTKLSGLAAGHFGSLADGEAAVKPIKAFGSPVMDVLGPIPYVALNSMLDASFPKGARNYWKSHFLPALTDEAIDAVLDAFSRCGSPMSQVVIEHFHGAATRVPRTETAYALRSSGFNLLFLSQWSDPAHDAAGIAWAREAYASIRPYVGSSRYVNYLDHDDTADAAAAVYGPNVARLREIKRKYDPDNVFHVNVNIAP
jgi:FAD/FMN-containing dehydrogenase